jgi:hypothetical protein
MRNIYNLVGNWCRVSGPALPSAKKKADLIEKETNKHRTSNVQHRILHSINFYKIQEKEHSDSIFRNSALGYSAVLRFNFYKIRQSIASSILDVRCWALDVRCSTVFRSRLQRDLRFRPGEVSYEISITPEWIDFEGTSYAGTAYLFCRMKSTPFFSMRTPRVGPVSRLRP